MVGRPILNEFLFEETEEQRFCSLLQVHYYFTKLRYHYLISFCFRKLILSVILLYSHVLLLKLNYISNDYAFKLPVLHDTTTSHV